jgi:hypothetical protein
VKSAAQLFTVIEMDPLVPQYLVVFVPLAGNQQQVSAANTSHRQFDGGTTLKDNHKTSVSRVWIRPAQFTGPGIKGTLAHLFQNRLGIFAARIV